MKRWVYSAQDLIHKKEEKMFTKVESTAYFR